MINQSKFEKFKIRNKKQIRNYKQFVGWCSLWLITAIGFLFVGGMISTIIAKAFFL